MLQIFCGNDPIQVRQKAFAFIAKREEKGARLQGVDVDTYEKGVVADAVGALSLFGGETVYLFDTPSEDETFDTEVHELLEALSESPTQFVVIEGPLLAAQKKAYEKYGVLEEYKASAKERFNAFALADALSRRDKKTLWMGLCDAKREGLSAEEIIGTLWWQLKTLRLALHTKTAEEAGMKDFPYNKAKRALSNFKEGELEKLSHALLAVYHQGHMGEVDIDLALEKWCLTV